MECEKQDKKIMGEGSGEIIFRHKSGYNPVTGFGVNDVTLMFQLPLMASYIIIPPVYVQIIFTFLTKHALKFQYPAQYDRE